MDIPYIPYFQTTRYRVDAMIELADPKPGEKGIDLGSGDGRIVIAFAKKGVEMKGLELDEGLQELSKDSIAKEKLTNVTIEGKDFWNEDLSNYDIVTIYPMPDILNALEEKVQKELQPGARLLLNYYQLPKLKPKNTKDHIYLYTF